MERSRLLVEIGREPMVRCRLPMGLRPALAR
jgi:hypothetical protein